MSRGLFVILILGTILVPGCSETSSPQPEPAGTEPAAGTTDSGPTVSVYVVNYPLEYFAREIGRDAVDVQFPVPAGVDPAYWSPDPETVAAYQTADLVLLNGAGYAKWAVTAALPGAAVVDTSGSFSDRLIEVEEGTTHTHGPEGEHVHRGWTITTWLDPALAVEQARAVAAAIVSKRPELEVELEANLRELSSRLESWDERIRTVAAAWGDRPVLFSHPVYQYFERRYGWNGRSVHWEPGEAPTEAQWRDLEQLLAEHPAELMIWEGEPDPGTANRLTGLGIRSVVFAPVGNRPPDGDYGSATEANVARLESVIGDRVP